jgi:hypothetical protein
MGLCIGFGQEVVYQLGKARGVLNLRPVAALAKHVQLRARDPAGQRQRVGKRNHPVFAAVHHQGRWGKARMSASG